MDSVIISWNYLHITIKDESSDERLHKKQRFPPTVFRTFRTVQHSLVFQQQTRDKLDSNGYQFYGIFFDDVTAPFFESSCIY